MFVAPGPVITGATQTVEEYRQRKVALITGEFECRAPPATPEKQQLAEPSIDMLLDPRYHWTRWIIFNGTVARKR